MSQMPKPMSHLAGATPEVNRVQATTVVAVAAEPLVREGLVATVPLDFYVVGSVGTLSEALRAIDAHAPTLCAVVLGPPLPDASVVDTCAALVGADVFTLALFREAHPRWLAAACRHGVRGFLDTSATTGDLHAALRTVSAGEVAVHPSLLSPLVEATRSEEPPESIVSAIQLRTLQLLADGYNTKEIARLLGSTAAAVNHQIERASRRLNATNRSHAVARAFRLGLMS